MYLLTKRIQAGLGAIHVCLLLFPLTAYRYTGCVNRKAFFSFPMVKTPKALSCKIERFIHQDLVLPECLSSFLDWDNPIRKEPHSLQVHTTLQTYTIHIHLRKETIHKYEERKHRFIQRHIGYKENNTSWITKEKRQLLSSNKYHKLDTEFSNT